MRRLNVGFAAGMVAAAFFVFIAFSAGLRSSPPADTHDGELQLSESCEAEIASIPQKMIDYQKTYGVWPMADEFWPACALNAP